MLDLERGAFRDPDDRLKGEILASLSDWTAEFGLVRLDLAYSVTSALLQHVAREQPLDAYIEFLEKEAGLFAETALQIRAIISDDFKRRRN